MTNKHERMEGDSYTSATFGINRINHPRYHVGKIVGYL